MPTLSKTVRISAPADAVWQVLRDFGAVANYVPPIASAELSGDGVGAERTLTLADGAQVVERLTSRDDARRRLRYTIVDGPLPVDTYTSTLRVEEAGPKSCRVTWAGQFDVGDAPEQDVADTFRELYSAGLKGLKSHVGGRAA